MIFNSESPRPHIDYPCIWAYKIIGTDINQLLSAIDEAALGLSYEVSPSNISSTGKYFSLNLSLEVPNEVVRDLIFQKLDNSPVVKFVI